MQSSPDKLEQIKGIKNGKGIQHILNEAYEILGNPILIHDMEYKVVDYNKGVVTDDPIWNEYATTGTVGYSWLDFFKNECFLEEAANAKKVTFLTSAKLEYNRLYGKLFNKNNVQVGCAVLVACNKPFEPDDPIFFESICDLLTKELGKSELFNKYGQVYFEKLINELIAGVDDIALYAAHVESIYMHLKANLYLAVVDIENCDSTYEKLAYYRDLFKKTQPEYTYAAYANYILIIIGTDEPVLYVERDLSKLDRLFRKNNIYAGVSGPFENLFELNKYYEEALEALMSKSEQTNQRIILCNQAKDS